MSGNRSDEKGLIIVHTGDGKGKSTAAFGMIFRSLGWEKKVAVVQFIKGKWDTGEQRFATSLKGVDFHVMGCGFTWDSDDLSKDKAAAREAWEKARNIILNGDYDLVILDEITYTFKYDFLSLEVVQSTLREKPRNLHVVITGRNAPRDLIEMADLVTEMKMIKHPYQQNIPVQKGVDF